MIMSEHIHQLKRKKTKGGTEMFFCTLPDCAFRDEKDYLNGKKALCPGCGNPMILGYEELRRAIPKCVNCRDDKTSKTVKAARNLLGDLILVRDEESEDA